MIYAIVNNNIVESILETDDVESYLKTNQLIIDITDIYPQPNVGWVLNGNKLEGEDPVLTWKITRLAMRQRFTTDELISLYAAANTIVILKILLDNLSVSTYVDLSSLQTQYGISLLVSYSILTQERATQILTTAPTKAELYE